MSEDKSCAKRCMVVMNSILLVIALVLMGSAWFISSSTDPAVQAISGYCTFIGVVAIIIAVFAMVGFCASCGGCFLFFYAIAMNILSFICAVLAIVGIVLFVLSRKNPETNNTVIKLVDKAVQSYINNPASADTWKDYQKMMNCCGYNNEGRTGELCENPDIKDCRVDMINVLSKYLLYTCIVLCVLTVVIYIISCSSNSYLKEGGCCSNFCVCWKYQT